MFSPALRWKTQRNLLLGSAKLRHLGGEPVDENLIFSFFCKSAFQIKINKILKNSGVNRLLESWQKLIVPGISCSLHLCSLSPLLYLIPLNGATELLPNVPSDGSDDFLKGDQIQGVF